MKNTAWVTCVFAACALIAAGPGRAEDADATAAPIQEDDAATKAPALEPAEGEILVEGFVRLRKGEDGRPQITLRSFTGVDYRVELRAGKGMALSSLDGQPVRAVGREFNHFFSVSDFELIKTEEE